MKDKVAVETFDVNLDDLTLIQKTFISPDARFVYFRKGEAENNLEVVAMIVITVFAVVYKVVKDYPELRKGVKAILEDVKATAKIVLRYVRKPLRRPRICEIACPDDPEVTITLEILRTLGGDVRYLPRERRGRFRFFVNDKEYCLFVRGSTGRFSGVIGNDPKMVKALKEAFESEWDELTLLQNTLVDHVPGIADAKKWHEE